MPKINLIKRQTLSIDEFRAWLTQLIQDKKGALPDLNDWKLIKEQLDKVGGSSHGLFDDPSGYSILQNDDDEYAFACGGAEPYDFQYTLDLLDKLCIEADSEYDSNTLTHDGVFNNYYDEYIKQIKPTEWEADDVLACAVREIYKEYEDGKTKTESNSGDEFTSNT